MSIPEKQETYSLEYFGMQEIISATNGENTLAIF